MASPPARSPLVVIAGPTGVGKTEMAIRLGESLGAEIVSADSRQIYRHMDIGTAKPTSEQIRRVPHHLLDLVDPDCTLTLAQYQEAAYAVIDGLHARGALPLLVGGTGLYVWAVVEGWAIPRAEPNHDLRARLYAEADAHGAQAMHERLRHVDPVAAERIDPRNVRRVIRALEVYEITGTAISELQRKSPPPYRLLLIGLTLDREKLYDRIDRRIDHMMAAGLLAEVKGLVARGYDYSLPSMSGLGYKQLGMYLRGKVGLGEAVQLIKRHTRRFIRHQYNWFRPGDDRIRWYDVDADPYADINADIRQFLGQTVE